jgi:hypothetical protein
MRPVDATLTVRNGTAAETRWDRIDSAGRILVTCDLGDF